MKRRRLLALSAFAALAGSVASALRVRRRRPDETDDAAVEALRERMERARADLLRGR